MVQSEKFWDRIANRYERQPVSDEATYQKKLSITRGYFEPDMQVLELGCGTGSTAIAHAPYVRHILAIDISSKMIEIAQGKADADGVGNVTFSHSAIDKFEVACETLDVVLGLNVLHLLDNMDEVVTRVYSMLKPGGVFVTSTACVGDMSKFFRLLAPVGYFLRFIPRVKVVTVGELEHSLTSAGFNIDYQWHPGKNKAVFVVARK
jgi:ubiquinone/menaquinone biosynthesis C-methylase UbiE